MAGPDIFVLSSSPATASYRPQARHESNPAATATILISSSPGELPAMNHLLNHDHEDTSLTRQPRPPLRTGSNAAPIPENALASFTSAASMLRSALASSDLGDAPTETEDETRNIAVPPPQDPTEWTTNLPVEGTKPIQIEEPASRRTRAEAGAGALEKADTRAIPAKKTTSTADLSVDAFNPKTTTLAKAARRARQTKVTAPKEQTKIPKGRVTKPDVRDGTKDKQPRRKAETVSKHFAREGSAPKIHPAPKSAPTDEPIDLEPAVARRMDWTPPPANKPPAPVPGGSSPVGKEVFTQIPVEAQPVDRVGFFTSLHDAFSCKADEDGRSRSREGSNAPSIPPTVASEAVAEVLRKRKLVDAFATSDQTEALVVEKAPTKTKAPKKKPRTITELATAAYRVPSNDNASAGEQTEDSLLNYFSVQDSVGKLTGAANEEMVPIAGADTKTRPPAKKLTKSKAPLKKKAAPRKQLVLSPASARAQVSQQEFVFGTHSQLAVEEDPALAMQASNQLDQVTEEVNLNCISPPAPALVPGTRVNKLWGASARDENGDLLEVEFVDLCSSSSPTPADVSLPGFVPPAPEGAEVQACDSITRTRQAPGMKLPVKLTEPPAACSSRGTGAQLHPLRGTTDQPFAADKLLFSDALDLSVLDLTQVDTVPATHTFHSLIVKHTPGPVSGKTPAAIEGSNVVASSLAVLDADPPASNQEQHQQIQSSTLPRQSSPPTILLPRSPSVPSRPPSPSTDEGPRKPSYQLYTDAQLAGVVSSYGYKAIKKRSAMIALLDQCWESKHRQHLNKQTAPSMSTTAATAAIASKRKQTTKQTTSTTAKASRSSAPSDAAVAKTLGAASPSRPRGRPRKASDAAPGAALASPTRPRGGPRKDLDAGATATAVKKTTKATTKKVVSEAPAKPPDGKSPGKRPRGRPRNDASVSAAAVEVIASSEDAATKTRKSRSKNKAATSTAVLESKAPATPRRRKAATAPAARATPAAIEIPDSESEDPFASPPPPMSPIVREAHSPRLTPQPRRATSRPRGVSASSRSPRIEEEDDDGGLDSGESDTEAALAAGDTGDVDAADLSLLASAAAPASDAQAAMFRAITRAVTTAPRSHDAALPSWHEKMLMYDPVVVEDLAAWLNGGQLDRVGFDGEVDAKGVKKWCASKSVCCVGRETNRGRQRRRV